MKVRKGSNDPPAEPEAACFWTARWAQKYNFDPRPSPYCLNRKIEKGLS